MAEEPADDSHGRGAVVDPAGYYTDPTAIQADKTLTKAQKRRYLAALAEDLQSARDPDGVLQDDVAEVRSQVDGEPDGRTGRGVNDQAPE